MILCAGRWYLRYSLSFRDVEELLRERGLEADHTTIWRWVQHYGPGLVGRILPISPPIVEALARRRARRDPDSPLVFHRDGITIRRWRTAWRIAC